MVVYLVFTQNCAFEGGVTYQSAFMHEEDAENYVQVLNIEVGANTSYWVKEKLN